MKTLFTKIFKSEQQALFISFGHLFSPALVEHDLQQAHHLYKDLQTNGPTNEREKLKSALSFKIEQEHFWSNYINDGQKLPYVLELHLVHSCSAVSK